MRQIFFRERSGAAKSISESTLDALYRFSLKINSNFPPVPAPDSGAGALAGRLNFLLRG
jgi:hypothetical protein